MAERVLYVGASLPARSETFVYRELLALRARGVRVGAASVHPPERNLGDPALEALADEAIGIYGAGTRALLRDAWREFVAEPRRALRTIGTGLLDALVGDVPLRRRHRIVRQLIAGLALASRARPWRPDHVHAHMAHVPATIAMYAALQLGVKFSMTGHAVDLFRQRTLLREKLRRSEFVACISHWHREFYRQIVALPDERLPIVRCGVDERAFAPGRPWPAVPSVLGVGRLVPKKGFDLLIDAAAMLRPRWPALRVVVAGDGPELPALRALALARGVDDVVEFLGAVDNRRVAALLSSASIFALPCRTDATGDRDGIPVVLMEAMACAVPVVAGDLPALRELVIHEKTGLIAPPESVAALAGAIDRVLSDPRRAEEMARAGRRHVEQEFTITGNAARLHAAMGASGNAPTRTADLAA